MTISVMTDSDIRFATTLADLEKWGYLADDFRRLRFFEPEGCFIARTRGWRSGMITSTCYDDYAFLGSLIVRKRYRKKRVGESLMRHAIAYLQKRGVTTIELDAVFLATGLYRRLGFRDKCLSLRFFRAPKQTQRQSPTRRVATAHELVDYDSRRTGLQRGKIVRRYAEEFADSLFISGEDSISGYAFVRPKAAGRQAIGPFVANDINCAERILSAILAAYSTSPLSIGVLETNRDMVPLLLQNEFTYALPSLRMYLGERREYDRHIYGILAPEKG